jgi:hypothetical protein
LPVGSSASTTWGVFCGARNRHTLLLAAQLARHMIGALAEANRIEQPRTVSRRSAAHLPTGASATSTFWKAVSRNQVELLEDEADRAQA